MKRTKEAAQGAPEQLLTVDRLPNITWHRLKMNEAQVDVSDLAAAPLSAVEVTVPIGVAAHENVAVPAGSTVFDEALDQVGCKYLETGMGTEAQAWFDCRATRRVTVEVPRGTAVEEALVVHLDGVDGAVAAVALDVIVRSEATVKVVVEADSPQAGTGVVGSAVRIFAERGAWVRLTSLQTLDATWKHLDDVGIYAADEARVQVGQTVLGGSESYVGLAADLAGYRSVCDVDTHYLGRGEAALDFNYVLRQRAVKTEGKLIANGVLSDASRKTLRGTIDLIHGCKGSVGRETETVLLSNEQVRNKTIPVILCDEDDVRGDHGATIGHVNPQQLEYLRSRGLSVGQVEDLFVQASFDGACDRAQGERGRAAVERLAQSTLGASRCEKEGTR